MLLLPLLLLLWWCTLRTIYYYHTSNGNPRFLLVETWEIDPYIPPGSAYSGQFLVSKSMFLGDNTIIPPLDNDIKLWTNRNAGLMADNSFISRSTVQYRGLFVLGHMNIVLGWRLGTIYIMCPWTNNPLYCTVDREIKPHYSLSFDVIWISRFLLRASLGETLGPEASFLFSGPGCSIL